MTRTKCFAFLGVCLLFFTGLKAQEKKPVDRIQFRSYNLVGLLEGESGSAFQLQTVNGFQNKGWFAGIGLGLDYYQFRSVPLFVDLRRTFSAKSNGFYGYADAGIQFPWVTESQKTLYESQFSNGFYGDIGLGYQGSMGHGKGFIISIGYTYKAATENSTIQICPFAGPCYPDHTKIAYQLNRLSLKTGIIF